MDVALEHDVKPIAVLPNVPRRRCEVWNRTFCGPRLQSKYEQRLKSEPQFRAIHRELVHEQEIEIG